MGSRRLAIAFAIAGCGNATPTSTPSTQPTASGVGSGLAPPAAIPCGPGVPVAACKLAGGITVCTKPDDPTRVGEWRYAVVAPPYGAIEDVSLARLSELWKGGAAIHIEASPETRAALAGILGASPAHEPVAVASPPAVDDTHWAIVPADQLTPHGKLVAVDGHHPLDRSPGALAVPLCAAAGGAKAVRNIDPAKLTILAMTGTTALTRQAAKLMDHKGVLYPLPAVEPWFASADLVHISNEVSFVPNCDSAGKATMTFCSKNEYIELLEKSHTKIIELTGSHLIDYGRQWLTKTIDMYEQRGWLWFGGGRDQFDASEPKFLDHNGNRLAFLGCNMVYTVKHALDQGPGVGACNLARMQWQIRDLKRRGFVPIVTVQHDEVYKHDPPPKLVADLRLLAEAGPIYVMGSQAHCPHPWEVHRGAYVHYGPGNLYFDQFWHPVRDAAHDKLYIQAGKLLAVSHMYTRTEERGRPRLLDDRERGELLTDLAQAHGRLPPGAEPSLPPIEVTETATRPDSVVIGGALIPVVVTVPKSAAAKSAVIALDEANDTPPADPDRTPDHLVVRLAAPADKIARGKLVDAISALLAAHYRIERAAITVSPPDGAASPAKRSARH